MSGFVKLTRASAFLAAITLTAGVWAAEEVRLTTPVSGVVKEVYVAVGQKVKKGDRLLALDDTRLKARAMLAEAALTRAREEAADAERELKRATELYERGVSSTTELDAAKLKHARALTAAKEAEARQLIAQKDLEDSVLKALFDGVVKARAAEPGLFVPAELNPPTLIILGRTR